MGPMPHHAPRIPCSHTLARYKVTTAKCVAGSIHCCTVPAPTNHTRIAHCNTKGRHTDRTSPQAACPPPHVASTRHLCHAACLLPLLDISLLSCSDPPLQLVSHTMPFLTRATTCRTRVLLVCGCCTGDATSRNRVCETLPSAARWNCCSE
jgi:hypothetical protein